MYLNDYSVVIPEGSERPGGYVEMEHGKKYTLRLRNSNSTPCDAQVEIDGKHVGTWRLRPHWGFTLERPAHDDGCFTFYEVGTEAARKAGVDAYSADTGLVRVTFLPGKEEEVSWTLTYSAGSQNLRGTTITDSAPVSNSAYYSRTAPVSKSGGKLSLASSQSYTPRGAGGTGLSGKSNQRFVDVGPLDYDYSRQTTINLRLVPRTSNGDEPRPLTTASNPVPPRVW
jgi:hypothetical protein